MTSGRGAGRNVLPDGAELRRWVRTGPRNAEPTAVQPSDGPRRATVPVPRSAPSASARQGPRSWYFLQLPQGHHHQTESRVGGQPESAFTALGDLVRILRRKRRSVPTLTRKGK